LAAARIFTVIQMIMHLTQNHQFIYSVNVAKTNDLNSIIALVVLISAASIILVLIVAMVLGVPVPIHIRGW
jgi:hypothetical protein